MASPYSTLKALLWDYVKDVAADPHLGVPETDRIQPNPSNLKKCLHSVSTEQRYHLIETVKSTGGGTAIHIAVRSDHLESLKCLLSSFPTIERTELLQIQDSLSYTAIHYAAMNNYAVALRRMLKPLEREQRFELLKTPDVRGYTAIQQAAMYSNEEAMKEILDSVAPARQYELIRAQNEKGCTALHRAAGKGFTHTIICLLNNMSPELSYDLIQIQDDWGLTAIHRSAMRGHTETTICMLNKVTPTHKIHLLCILDKNLRTALDTSELSANMETADVIRQHLEIAEGDLLDLKGITANRVKQAEIDKEAKYEDKDEIQSQNADLHETVNELKEELQKCKAEKYEEIVELKEQLKEQEIHHKMLAQQKEDQMAALRTELADLQRKYELLTAGGESCTEDDTERQVAHDTNSNESMGSMKREDQQLASGKFEVDLPVVEEPGLHGTGAEGISNVEDITQLPNVFPDVDGVKADLDCSVFDELEEYLSRLCIKYEVEDFLIHQNPVDFTDVVIVGVNASKIPKEEFAKVSADKRPWAVFKICAEEPDDDEDEIELLVNSKIRGKTLARLNGTCEMLVTASVKSPENNNEIAEFAVGPAHMMFSDETNRQLRNGEGLAEARDFVKLNPPHTKYEVHFGTGEGQLAVIDTHHPPLIGYRYKGPEQNVSTSRGPHTADYLNETYVPSEDDREVDCKFCLNDIVLLRLDSEEAKRFHGGLSWHGGRKVQLVRIDFSSDLLKYTRPERSVKIPIEVKRKKGFLVKHSLSAAQLRKRREPYHLRFKLYGGEKLEEGDSGSVVFEVINNQELRPLGMLTGRVRNVRQRFGEIYQAVILSRAFKDISTECAPDVEHIRPYNCVEEPIEPPAAQPDVD